MKKIRVGIKFALVDEEDFDRLSKFKWWIMPRNGNAYAYTNIDSKTVYMHQMVCGYLMADHRDRNGLNNQKSNLRKSTTLSNAWNKGLSSRNSSGLKGVHFDKWAGKWKAEIQFMGRNINLGRFVDKVKAAIAYNSAAIKYFGEFAFLNKIPKTQTPQI